jgi:NADH dehydrogenase
MPSWERKIRVIVGWINNFFLGRDIVSLAAATQPRAAFEEFASRPKPAEAPAKTAKTAAPAKAPKAAAAAKAPSTTKAAAAKAPVAEAPAK